MAILSLSVDALKALRFLQREECDTVGRLYLEQAVLQEVQRLLAALLRHVLGREVRASRMLDLLAHEGLREGADALSRMEATKG